MVEPSRDLSRQLEVLALIITDRHTVCVIEQDVGRHEDRVGEEAHAHGLLTATLVLELGHPTQFTHRRGALQEPGQLLMRRHMTLHEEGAAGRIKSGGKEHASRIKRLAPQNLWVDRQGQCMEVDDAEVGV